MKKRGPSSRQAARALLLCATLASGVVFGFLPSCETLLTTFDPCGTILGNCEPGTFDLLFADVPDWGVDPGCTVPGGCTGDDPWVDPFDQLGPGAWP